MRRHGHPLDHVRADEVEEVLRSLTSLDKDEWGSKWCQVGLAHEARGDALAKNNAPPGQIRDAYDLAFGYSLISQYPFPELTGETGGLRSCPAHVSQGGTLLRPAARIVEIPFEGKTLVGYLQMPNGVTRPPVVMYWGGVDVWKEDHQRNSAIMHRAGLATFLIDGPGTGENPVAFTDPNAERVLSAVMTRLATRTDVDGSRVGAWGRSFGAYWTAKLAHIEPVRLKAAVFRRRQRALRLPGGMAAPGADQEHRPNYLLGPASLFDSRSFVLGVRTLEDEFRVGCQLRSRTAVCSTNPPRQS